MQKIEWEILQFEVPKAPEFQRPIFMNQQTAGLRKGQVSKERSNQGLGSNKEANHSQKGLGHMTTHGVHDARISKPSKPSENKKNAQMSHRGKTDEQSKQSTQK